MSLALLQKDHIGQAAAERYLDLCLHSFEKILELKITKVEELPTEFFNIYKRLKWQRNAFVHRYTTIKAENVRYEIIRANKELEKLKIIINIM